MKGFLQILHFHQKNFHVYELNMTNEMIGNKSDNESIPIETFFSCTISFFLLCSDKSRDIDLLELLLHRKHSQETSK